MTTTRTCPRRSRTLTPTPSPTPSTPWKTSTPCRSKLDVCTPGAAPSVPPSPTPRDRVKHRSRSRASVSDSSPKGHDDRVIPLNKAGFSLHERDPELGSRHRHAESRGKRRKLVVFRFRPWDVAAPRSGRSRGWDGVRVANGDGYISCCYPGSCRGWAEWPA
ncbi:unnamed protein product [Scytosiphon promiscuus]